MSPLSDMKVCLITARHEFRMSGEMESILNLQKYLKLHGVHADVLTPRGVYVPRMETSATGLHWSKVFDFCALLTRLRRVREQYDLMHLFLPFPSLAWYADILKIVLRTRLVVTFEGCAVEVAAVGAQEFRGPGSLGNIMRLLLNNRLLARWSCYQADAYIVSSRYQQGQVGRPDVKVIPNLTDAELYSPRDRGASRRSLDLPPGDFLLAYVGHLLEIKGISDLLAAFSRLVCGGHHARLVIAASGIGPAERVKNMVEDLRVSDRVTFLGKVDVASLLSAVDLLVVPYRVAFGTNWIPSIILEGLSVGVKILTTDLGPLRELREQGANLLLARPRDVGDLAAQVLSVMLEATTAEGPLAGRGQSGLAASLHPDCVVTQYMTVYEKVIHAKD